MVEDEGRRRERGGGREVERGDGVLSGGGGEGGRAGREEVGSYRGEGELRGGMRGRATGNEGRRVQREREGEEGAPMGRLGLAEEAEGGPLT